MANQFKKYRIEVHPGEGDGEPFSVPVIPIKLVRAIDGFLIKMTDGSSKTIPEDTIKDQAVLVLFGTNGGFLAVTKMSAKETRARFLKMMKNIEAVKFVPVRVNGK